MKVARCASLTEFQKYFILVDKYTFSNQQNLGPSPEPSDLQGNGKYVFCYSEDDTGEVLEYIPDCQVAFEEQHRHDAAGVLIGQGMPNSIVFMTREGHPKELPQEIPVDSRFHWRTLGFVTDDLPVRCRLHQSNGNTHCLLSHEHAAPCANCSNCSLEGFMKCSLDHTSNCNTLKANADTNPWLRLLSGTAHLEHNEQNLLPHLLSGRLAIFWGLVALNVGENIHDLESYFLVRDHQLRLNTPQFDS